MRITIRQLNGCLSAMQIAKMHPGTQKDIAELIQVMVGKKQDSIEMEEDEVTKAVVEMSKLHANLVRVQKHNR